MKFWNLVKNAATDTTSESIELRIEGDIIPDDDVWIYELFGMPAASPNAFREELEPYKDKDITVWINSFGGDVFAAAGIYNILKEHKGKVTVKVDGKAMSAASVIAMAGSDIQMSPVGIMMIHNPMTFASGDERDMKKTMEILGTVKDTLINAYMGKTHKNKEQISTMMDDESWMSAAVAVKEGFADSVMYQEGSKDVMNLAFNRSAILNSANDSFKRLFEFENKNHGDADILKDKLLLQLQL